MLGVADVDVNDFGPFHEYVPPPVAVNLISVPKHTGLLLDAVAVGFGLIVTEVDILIRKYGEENLTITTSGLAIFLQSVKYRYYPIFMIFLMFCIIGFKRDYGPMLVAERKVTIFQRTDGGDGKGKQSSTSEHKANQPDPNKPLYAFNMLLPVVVLVCYFIRL